MGLTVGSSRRTALLALGLVLIFALVTIAPGWQPVAQAQADGAAPPPAPAGGGGGGTNIVFHIFKSLGWFFGFVLGTVSICLVALIVLLAMDLRMNVAIPPGFVEEFTDTVNKRQFKQAFDMTRADNSFLGRVLTAGMGRLQYGIEDSREASFNMVDSTRAAKEQWIGYLATIGTLGPLLGLVGTVYGMIQSFMVLGKEGPIQTGSLAVGISHALAVTLVGVFLAVPAIFCHQMFRSRLTRISMDVGSIADDLLTQMFHNSRQQQPARPNATASTSASAVGLPRT